MSNVCYLILVIFAWKPPVNILEIKINTFLQLLFGETVPAISAGNFKKNTK